MRRVQLFCGLLAAAAAILAGGPAQAEHGLLDAVVAVVNEKVITLSDIEVEARVIIVKRFGYGSLPEEIDDDLRASVIEYIVNRYIVLTEAERLGVSEPETGKVDGEVEGFIALFPDRKAFDFFLASGGISLSELRDAFARDLRVENYLQRKLKLAAWAEDADVKKYYDGHRGEFGEKPFEDVKEAAKQALLKARSEAFLAKWLDDLRAKNDVRIIMDFK